MANAKSGIEERLTAKLGPLPVWVWGLAGSIVIVGYIWWRDRQAETAMPANTNDTNDNTGNDLPRRVRKPRRPVNRKPRKKRHHKGSDKDEPLDTESQTPEIDLASDEGEDIQPDNVESIPDFYPPPAWPVLLGNSNSDITYV